ncbi:hypothetical protein FQR65_LT02988 [Abscondita terminalis]|nr:hypothetical protein FQR65_LT02988 [Abscondita terminalis]
MCDSYCVSTKLSIIALALIQTEFERFVSTEIPNKLMFRSHEILQLLTTVVDLQLICLIDPAEFTACHKRITDILKDYDSSTKSFHHQNLLWRYSSRTIYTTKSSWSYFNALHTILEE